MKTHCYAGHPFTPENTLVRKDGYRVCRACKRAHAQKTYALGLPGRDRTQSEPPEA